MVVVLPAPLGPSKPKISPSSTENETSSTATSEPYVLRRLATVITADTGREYPRGGPGLALRRLPELPGHEVLQLSEYSS